jgi:hypothetical protein
VAYLLKQGEPVRDTPVLHNPAILYPANVKHRTSIHLPVGWPIKRPRLVVGFSEGIYHIMERAAPVFAILAEAAKNEPELANLQNRIQSRAPGRHAPGCEGDLQPGCKIV